jgi:hypothetical protein
VRWEGVSKKMDTIIGFASKCHNSMCIGEHKNSLSIRYTAV